MISHLHDEVNQRYLQQIQELGDNDDYIQVLERNVHELRNEVAASLRTAVRSQNCLLSSNDLITALRLENDVLAEGNVQVSFVGS